MSPSSNPLKIKDSRMSNTTLLYYTHNLVPKPLLLKSLFSILETSKKLGLELVITSQFPLSKNPEYESICMESSRENIDKFVVWGEFFDEKDYPNAKTFVIGRFPRLLTSLVKQLVYTLKKVNTQNVIFTEHDVLYPEGYFEAVLEKLNSGSSLVYAANSIMFCRDGFYSIPKSVFLSKFSGNTKFFLDHFSKKAVNIGCFEPILWGISPISPFAKINPQDICRDFTVLELLNPVLDIKHGLNTSGHYIVSKYQDSNSYWGSKDEILKLISNEELEKFFVENPNILIGLDALTKTKWKPQNVKSLFQVVPDSEMIDKIRKTL